MRQKVRKSLLLIGLLCFIFLELLLWREYSRGYDEYRGLVSLANENYSDVPWMIKEGGPLILGMVGVSGIICLCLFFLIKDAKIFSSYFKWLVSVDEDQPIMLFFGTLLMIGIFILMLWSVFFGK